MNFKYDESYEPKKEKYTLAFDEEVTTLHLYTDGEPGIPDDIMVKFYDFISEIPSFKGCGHSDEAN